MNSKKIDYSHTESSGRVVFGHVDLDISFLKILEEETKGVQCILKEFQITCNRKNIISYNTSCEAWIGFCETKDIIATKYDVQRAYDLAYGDGCEFEWSCA